MGSPEYLPGSLYWGEVNCEVVMAKNQLEYDE